MALSAARVITPDEEYSPGFVTVECGVVSEVGKGAAPGTVEAEDLGDLTLAPGYVDLHVHGGGGHSLATNDPGEIARYAAWAPSTGVTSFLATVVAGDLELGLGFTRTIAGARVGRGADLLGVNMEGPFLNSGWSGAIPRSWIVPPDAGTLGQLLEAAGGRLRLMTLAPEVDGALAVVPSALSRGVAISVGHTDATYEAGLNAFRAGASHVTHAFNAMRPFHHREPGPLGAALEAEGVTVEAIADGVHLHPATLHWLISAFGSSRVALVTDGTPLAGVGDGSFDIGGAIAEVREGRASLADGTIAGSVATMDAVVRNVVSWGIVNLAEALKMASAVPARVAGSPESKGRIAPGYDADLIALDSDLHVARVWIAGKSVYEVKSG